MNNPADKHPTNNDQDEEDSRKKTKKKEEAKLTSTMYAEFLPSTVLYKVSLASCEVAFAQRCDLVWVRSAVATAAARPARYGARNFCC